MVTLGLKTNVKLLYLHSRRVCLGSRLSGGGRGSIFSYSQRLALLPTWNKPLALDCSSPSALPPPPAQRRPQWLGSASALRAPASPEHLTRAHFSMKCLAMRMALHSKGAMPQCNAIAAAATIDSNG